MLTPTRLLSSWALLAPDAGCGTSTRQAALQKLRDKTFLVDFLREAYKLMLLIYSSTEIYSTVLSSTKLCLTLKLI